MKWKDGKPDTIIKIIFLKKKLKGGFITYQNNYLQLFSNSPAFELIVVDEHVFLNSVYKFIQPTKILNLLFNYLYVSIQVIRNRKDADYFFIPHSFKYGLIGILISSLLKIPFIVPLAGWTENELVLQGDSRFKIFFKLKYEKLVFNKAEYVLASHDLAEGYSKVVKNKNKFLYVGLPIDINKFKPGRKSERLIDELNIGDKKVILTAAPLEGVKGEGVKKLLNAFICVKEKYSNVVLLIAGDGNQKNEIENIAKNLNVEDVVFLGQRTDMPELINFSDVFALIFAFGGGLGAAIKEAMACEKPCVVSRTSGTEVLNNEKEVLLAYFRSEDIADKILLLLKDEKYARNIGINARKRIENEHSIEKIGEKLIETLKIKMEDN